jgi:hypothetical protein
MVTTKSTPEAACEALAPVPETIVHPSSYSDLQLELREDDCGDDTLLSELENAESPETESNHLKMLESHSQANLKSRGEIS